MAKFTIEEAREALLSTRGMIGLAGDRLGVTHSAVSQRVSKSPELKAIVESFRERRTDVAELKLEQAIGAGEPWAVLFQLKTQGRGRGYVERQEVEHSGEISSPAVKEIVIEIPAVEEEVPPGLPGSGSLLGLNTDARSLRALVLGEGG